MTRISINKKYKRNICKNWEESGICNYGSKCQYAHGYEELYAVDQLTEEQLKAHDLFKTQNCRSFHKDMFCGFGKRCQWRREHRAFQKIHRHYWQPRLAALEYAFEDILDQSSESTQLSETKTETSSNASFIDTQDSFSLDSTCVSERRLSVFTSITKE